MGNRTDLNNLLKGMTENVYYQPPNGVDMSYPAIVYEMGDIQNIHANNNVYTQQHAYDVTVMDEDPDSEIADTVSKLPKCKFDRHFVSDNLNHTVFKLYY